MKLSPSIALESVVDMHLKKLIDDSKANASFAFAAVMILVTVTASSAAVYQMEKADQKLSSSVLEVESADKIKRAITSELELAIQACASKALNEIKQPFNLSDFQSAILILLKEYFQTNYPKRIGEVDVNATLQNLSTTLAPYRNRDSLNTTQPGGIVVFASVGIAAKSEKSNYRTKVEVSKEIITPIPFFANELDYIDESAKSEGKLGRIVKSILTQLAQLRVLQGYGAKGHFDRRGTPEILTAEDVELAVNLALAFVELSDFGTIDRLSWQSILKKSGGNSGINVTNDWFHSEIDPFRTLMLLNGDKSSSIINLRSYAVQILYSYVDRLVLRYLEYVNLIDLSDAFARAREFAHLGWQSVVELLTGVDQRTKETKEWVSFELEKIGAPETIWKSIFEGEDDIYLEARPTFVYIFDKCGNLAPIIIGKTAISLDLPQFSIIDSEIWKDFSNAILKNALATGGSTERIVMQLCLELSKHIPSIEIGFSQEGREAAALDILSRVKSSIDEISVDNLEFDDNLEPVSERDDLLVALAEFIDAHWKAMFTCDTIISSGRNVLATELGMTAISDDPSILPDNWRDLVKAFVLREMDDGYLRDWGVILEGGVRNESIINEQALVGILREAGTQEDSNSQLADGITQWIAEGVPVQIMMEGLRCGTDSLMEQLGNITREFSLNERIAIRSNREIELNQYETGDKVEIAPTLRQSPCYLNGIEIPSTAQYSINNVDSTGRLCISIVSPCQSSCIKMKSIHHTAIDGVPTFPYETNWIVQAKGTVEIILNDRFNPKQISKDKILIDLEIPITAFSGWALEEVQYESSNTLLGDAWNLFKEIRDVMWKALSPLIEIFFKAFAKLYDSLADLSKYISGFIEKVGRLFFDFGDWILSIIKGFVDWVRNSPLWDALEICFDAFGNIEFRFNYAHLTIIVSLSLPDLLFRKAKDLIRIIFINSCDGFSTAWGFRVAKLADGTFDIVSNASVKCRSLRLEMRLDPLMAVRDYFFEIDAFWRNLHLRIWSPEIDDYRRAGVELKDIPGLGDILSGIPIPALGITLSFNAGLRIKYRLPISDQLAINEVELNPAGNDAGREWIELYNPTSREISVDGYRLETMHGEIAVLDLKGSVPANGYRVFTFSQNSLDNGDPTDTFAVGDSILFTDPSGNVIDMTPLISDVKNDENTWHRRWDGAPKWEFGKPSKGLTNGNPMIHTYPDILTKICFDAMMLAFQDEQDNVSFSIDFLINLVRSFLRELIIVSADFIASLVYEVELFLDIGINDFTGSIGTGAKLKIMFGGELIKLAALWFMEQLIKILGNLLLKTTISPNLLEGAKPLEAIDLCAEFYCRAGTPKMLAGLLKSGDIPSEIRLAISFSINLALLGMFFGKEWGKYCVKFGLHIDDLPGTDLISPLRLNRERVDLWLLKGQLTPA